MDNFECITRNEYLTIHKKLKLDPNEYFKNFKTLNDRNPKIFIVNEQSDLKIGGRLTLKCGSEGFLKF